MGAHPEKSRVRARLGKGTNPVRELPAAGAQVQKSLPGENREGFCM